jgi:hypothetical protein
MKHKIIARRFLLLLLLLFLLFDKNLLLLDHARGFRGKDNVDVLGTDR